MGVLDAPQVNGSWGIRTSSGCLEHNGIMV
jgi:hypothetical protein